MRFPVLTSGEHGRAKSKNTHPPTGQPFLHFTVFACYREHLKQLLTQLLSPSLLSHSGDAVIQSLLSVEKDETRRAFLTGISEYRKLNKTKTSFMAPFLDASEEVRASPLDPPSHKAIFCNWNQTHTSTGRLSTSLPSLQNLPRGTKTVEEDEEEEDEEAELDGQAAAAGEADVEGRRASKTVLREINIRDCFRPESNHSLFLSADFNQMEMRIMSAFHRYCSAPHC